MADITMGAPYKEEVPQGTIFDYGVDLNTNEIWYDLSGLFVRAQWSTVLLAGRSIVLEVDISETRCTKLNGDVEVIAKTYSDFITDIAGDYSPANVSSWLTTNFVDLHKGT